ncbi:hypothetical protein QCA50_013773 [Cerrena zonata]|uniref:Uncharacterized protein n=1 Tax=Cerrena zonata TaxID=2478898 RepID=A0AAW0FP96_9APHY
MLHRLGFFRTGATENALNVVRSVLDKSTEPLTTQNLWKRVVREEATLLGTSAKVDPSHHATSTDPPFPTHAVRSVRHLKHFVLPELVRQERVKKIHSVRKLTQEEIDHRLSLLSKSAREKSQISTTTDVWMWTKTTPRPKPAPQPEPEPFGKAVGEGEDWGHLNRRRRRAREEKVANDVKWLHALERAREKGLKEAATKEPSQVSLS